MRREQLGGAPDVVVTDANVLINFIHIKQLGMLTGLARRRFSVPEDVVDEITWPVQAEALARAIEDGQLDVCSKGDGEAYELFSRLRKKIQAGEAACIAIAAIAGHSVATDERGNAERFARELLGVERLLRTEDVMKLCIAANLMTVPEADEFKRVLESKRYKMNFSSFADRIAA